MIDHSGVYPPNDQFEAAHKFYLAALAPIGYVQKMQFAPTIVGMGPTVSTIDNYSQANFWLTGVDAQPTHSMHFAFRAKSKCPRCTQKKKRRESCSVALTTADRAEVDAFYEAAIKAGGEDNGAPGSRPHYHEHYYAAFVKDPMGNNLEVVCHSAP
jgi:hypothetical protein